MKPIISAPIAISSEQLANLGKARTSTLPRAKVNSSKQALPRIGDRDRISRRVGIGLATRLSESDIALRELVMTERLHPLQYPAGVETLIPNPKHLTLHFFWTIARTKIAVILS
jgi:hypothetical protein